MIDKTVDGPKRLSIECGPLGKLPRAAVEFLVLNLNARQREVEFEFLPTDETHSLIAGLRPRSQVRLDSFRSQASKFVKELTTSIERASGDYGRRPCHPGRVVFVSLAALDTHFYELYEPDYSAIFLGDWDETMAPPSLLESLLTLVMLEGLYSLTPDPKALSHYATRGCIGDFNPRLRDARYKVLHGFICSDCRTVLEASVGSTVADNWTTLLGKAWIGRSEDPTSPSGIVRKLGYNMFLTKGYAPTRRERLFQLLQEEGPKELIKIVGGVLLAGLLLWLGLKK